MKIYEGKKVLVTGHTGFKGSWTVKSLLEFGAIVKGISLEPDSDPSHFELMGTDDYESSICDIRDFEKVKAEITSFNPDIVFHMAAQPLVRKSYDEPLETFETNIMGSLNIFQAARECENLKAIVAITTDKVYENDEKGLPFKESDPLGGHDPYSASKACMEIATQSFRKSFFSLDKYGTDHNVLLATARAGNVIGGGDWAKDRLIPDIVLASVAKKPLLIRYPEAIRPWQHVLDPLRGYFMLGERLLKGEKEFADAWNFGPNTDAERTVMEVVEEMAGVWEEIKIEIDGKEKPHEAKFLKLDCQKVKDKLDWEPIFTFKDSISTTVEWYKSYYVDGKTITSDQIKIAFQK